METTVELCINPQALVIHTNFNIKLHEGIKIIIENMEGVEDIGTFGCKKYEFTVCIGAMFNRESMALKIQQKIKEYFEYQ